MTGPDHRGLWGRRNAGKAPCGQGTALLRWLRPVTAMRGLFRAHEGHFRHRVAPKCCATGLLPQRLLECQTIGKFLCRAITEAQNRHTKHERYGFSAGRPQKVQNQPAYPQTPEYRANLSWASSQRPFLWPRQSGTVTRFQVPSRHKALILCGWPQNHTEDWAVTAPR